VLEGGNAHWHFAAGVASSSLDGEICPSVRSSSDGRSDWPSLTLLHGEKM